MVINLLRLEILFFVNVVVDYEKSPIFILSIIHFITFFSSQLDSLAGILIFLICKSNIHKMKEKIRMSLELEGIRSLSWSTFSTVSIPVWRSQITSSELESSFRNMLLMHGLSASRSGCATGKKTGTQPDPTDRNRTIGCGCVRLRRVAVPVASILGKSKDRAKTGCNRLQLVFRAYSNQLKFDH